MFLLNCSDPWLNSTWSASLSPWKVQHGSLNGVLHIIVVKSRALFDIKNADRRLDREVLEGVLLEHKVPQISQSESLGSGIPGNWWLMETQPWLTTVPPKGTYYARSFLAFTRPHCRDSHLSQLNLSPAITDLVVSPNWSCIPSKQRWDSQFSSLARKYVCISSSWVSPEDSV